MKTIELPFAGERILASTVRVGAIGRQGRGFIVHTADDSPVVITAAHNLPRWPAQNQDFPGGVQLPLRAESLDGDRVVTILAAFVDPCSDLAILSPSAPGCDSFEYTDEGVACQEFLESLEPLQTRRKPFPVDEPCRLYVCDVKAGWTGAKLHYLFPQRSAILGASSSAPIAAGTSGSPVVDDEGNLVGLVSSANDGGFSQPQDGGYSLQMARLPDALPLWAVWKPSCRGRSAKNTRKPKE